MCTYRLQSALHWHVWLNEIWLVLLGTGTRHHRQLMHLLFLNYIHPVIYHRQSQSEESQVCVRRRNLIIVKIESKQYFKFFFVYFSFYLKIEIEL